MRTRLSVLACVAGAIATLAGQQPGQSTTDPQDTAPVFRSGTNLIRVDLYPTRDGQFVTDLKPDDIQLYEDGVRQNVETFEFVRIGASPAAVNAEDSRTRIFIVFVDTNTAQLSGDTELRRSLLRFLDRTVQPSDLVGLMTPDMSAFDVILGRKSTVMSDVANDQRWLEQRSSPASDPKGFQWENCYSTGRRESRRVVEMKERRNARVTIEALRDLVDRLRDLREERKAVLLVTSGWPLDDETSLTTGSDNETRSCADDRKALLRINYGGLLKDLARSANRANVSFYPVSARPEAAFPRELPASLRSELRRRDRRTRDEVDDQLRELADTTDGLWGSQVRNMDKIAARIVDDTSMYYLLGYESSNTRADSKYRSITVKVNRPGVVVRSRPGYGGENVRVVKLLGTPPARPLMDSRVLTAIEGVERFEPANPVWFRSAAFTASTPAPGGALWVVGEAAARGDHWNGSHAEVIVTGADRREVFSQRFDLTADGGVFDLRVPGAGMLPFGTYSVRVRIQRADESSGPFVQDLPKVELAPTAAGLGEPVMWRHGPLVRDGFRHTADPRFRRNERLRLELATDVDETPLARVLDRFGQPLPIPIELTTRPDDAGGGTRWVVADLSLAGLAPGDYAVSVSQREKTQITAFRIVP